MKKPYMSFFLFILTSNIYANKCYIKSFNKIIRFDNNISKEFIKSQIIKDTNCTNKIINKFINIIMNSEGTINNHNISRIFNLKNSDNVYISPHKIKVKLAKSFLQEHFSDKTKDKKIWKDIKITTNEKIILLNKNDIINLECKTCDFLGTHNIKINIYNPIVNKAKTIWIIGKVVIKKEVLASKTYINISNDMLNKNNFYKKYIETDSPEDYFYNKEKLKYYKANKSILKNHPLKTSDISPINLVSPGRVIKTILRNKSLFISNNSISLDYGKLGETIKIKNNDKVIYGKIIDYNTVIVNL